MTNTNPDSNSTPEVQDKRVRPHGVLPQNMQVRVLGCVAALMVMFIGVDRRKREPAGQPA